MAWSTLVFVLVVGVPIFLCMPVWFDIYHYDICGRRLLRGEVLYRDMFDNNLPGIIWLQTCIRLLVGWRTDALRLVDLVFYSFDVVLLLQWVSHGARVWTAAALYAFYLFTPESTPCQRDIWMLLPATVGLTLRQRQVQRLASASPTVRSVGGWSALEGLCWGAAVWIKPFVFVPGFACWLAGFWQARRTGAGKAGLLATDAVGLLGGGIVAGALGLLWLWQTGSWPYFWEILLVWNRDYAKFTNRVRISEWIRFFLNYLPWSAIPVVAACLAVKVIQREGVNGPAAPSASGSHQPGQTLLAAFVLGYLFQGFFLQLPHDYPIVAAMIPSIALLGAGWRWPTSSSPVGFTARMGLVAVLSFVWAVNFHLHRVVHWAECCREGSTPRIQSLLATQRFNPYAPDPKALADVADYLRSQGAGDGEVTCLSGCTHPLYLILNLEPSTRYNQVEMTTLFFVNYRDTVLAEVNASRQRYIVSDLAWVWLTLEEAEETTPTDPLAFPSEFPEEFVGVYPWTEPVVFRSGRYLVHRVTGPATKFWREDSEKVNKAKNPNEYAKLFAGKMSFCNEEASRESVAVIDALYRQSELAGDRAGQHQALLKALSMFDQARWAGKEREAVVFRHWLRQNIGGVP